MPLPISDEELNALTQALQQGNKIEAIKLYRNFTRSGLKESKDAVEELESSLRIKYPDQFVPTSQRKAGLTLLLIIVFAAILIGFLAFRRA